MVQLELSCFWRCRLVVYGNCLESNDPQGSRGFESPHLRNSYIYTLHPIYSAMKLSFNKANTCVIADFDGTLIKKVVDGKKVLSLMSILVNEKNLGKAGVEEIKTLAEKYYPIELCHTQSVELKRQAMQEWWEKSYEILRKYKVSSRMIDEVCHSPMVQLRDGLIEFMAALHTNSIPLIIYSANGFGCNAIGQILEKGQLLTPNISICSNQITFDSDGFFIETKQPIIHSANKTGLTLIQNGYITQSPERKHCLLFGDSLDDAQMADGIDFEKVTKVVFADSAAPKFSDLFDVVLPLEGGFQDVEFC